MPDANDGAMQGVADAVIAACEARWDGFKGDCSGYVKAVAADLGVALSGQANDIVVALRTSWTKLDGGAAAAAAAERGRLVIGGLEDSPHGHVVVVVKGPLNRGKYPTAYWGQLGGVGRKATTINWSWNTADRDKVEYFSIKVGAGVVSGHVTAP